MATVIALMRYDRDVHSGDVATTTAEVDKSTVVDWWLNAACVMEPSSSELSSPAPCGELPMYVPLDAPDGFETVLARCLLAMSRAAKGGNADVSIADKKRRKLDVVQSLSEIVNDLITQRETATLKSLLDVAIKENIPPLYRMVLVAVTRTVVRNPDSAWLVQAMLSDEGWSALKICCRVADDWAPLVFDKEAKSLRSELAEQAVLRLTRVDTEYKSWYEKSGEDAKLIAFKGVEALVDGVEPQHVASTLRQPWAADAMARLMPQSITNMLETAARMRAMERIVNLMHAGLRITTALADAHAGNGNVQDLVQAVVESQAQIQAQVKALMEEEEQTPDNAELVAQGQTLLQMMAQALAQQPTAGDAQ